MQRVESETTGCPDAISNGANENIASNRCEFTIDPIEGFQIVTIGVVWWAVGFVDAADNAIIKLVNHDMMQVGVAQ